MKMKNRTEKITIAGFGGQGVMMLGQIIALSAVKSNLNSLWFPSYGPETRGGTANCSVIVSSEEIYSPVFKEADVLMALNRPSIEKFIHHVNQEGIIIYNSSLIQNKLESNNKLYGVPINELSQELGNPRVGNMIILGAYLALINTFNDIIIKEALVEYLGKEKESYVDINLQAIARGKKYIMELDN